jgi:GNAT superfamily N-acetyltransferase
MSESPRIRVRPVEPRDAAAVRPWLAEAVAAIQGRGVTPPEPDLTLDRLHDRWDSSAPRGVSAAGVLGDGSIVGLAHVHQERDALLCTALTVRASERNLGYGQELVIAFEAAYGSGCAIAAAAVPRTNGLAIYFWLRAGYRPVHGRRFRNLSMLEAGPLWMLRALR